jgi:hypothetical protein
MIALRLRLFLHDDRVGPNRKRSSGENADCLPGTYLPEKSGTRLGHSHYVD